MKRIICLLTVICCVSSSFAQKEQEIRSLLDSGFCQLPWTVGAKKDVLNRFGSIVCPDDTMKYNAAFSTRKKSYLAKVTINGIETKGMNSFIDADSLEDNTLRVIQSARTDEGKFMGRPVFLGDYKIYDPERFTATQRKVNVVVKDRYGETHTYKITITALSIGEELEFWERHVPENIEIAYKKEL